MGTNRTSLRRLAAHVNMAAVAADPDNLTLFAEDLVLLNIFQKLQVSGFMLFFNRANHLEQLGNMIETLFYGLFGKVLVHVGPIVVLYGSGIL